jgi:predicted dehydrogenase
MDIGCYPITTSRWIYGEEPVRVAGTMENDPEFGTDRLASAILEFRSGAVHIYLQHAACSVSAHAISGNDGANRNRDSV